ncbi:hypothetical protein O3G_MSEX004158 [Manduca sexta]|nr:hypothetical protein O3G_MSEX004158 [Manduca sexta]KAG6445907.1 hypothetical protein O3G_MSEX004158 [Manduca sexta]
MIPKFINNELSFGISKEETSWIAALSSPGYMAGSLATSYIADRFGRRVAILGSAIPMTIGTIILVCANHAWMIYIVRFIWGCSTGVFMTVSVIYLVEIADKDIRGTLNVANRFMFNFGSFVVMSVGPFVEYNTLNYMLLVLPIVYFSVCWWIPETPYYRLKEGNVDAARKELLLLRGYKDPKVLEEQLTSMESNVKKEMRRSGTAKELFTGRQYKKAIIIVMGLKLTQIMSGSIPIQQYFGSIIQESNKDIQLSTALILFGGLRFCAGILSSFLVDKVGRRPILITTYTGACLCLTTVAVYFYFKEVVGIENESTSPYRYITFVGINVSNVLATIGFDSLLFVIPAELFPINVKSVAMTCLNIFGGCMNFVTVKGYQSLKNWTGLSGVFGYFAVSALLGALFTTFMVPETKGKSLRQIQVELQGNIYDDADESLNKVSYDVNGKVDIEMNEIANNKK